MRNYWKIEFFLQNIDRCRPYKNGEKFLLSQNVLENIFVKIICSTHQKKCFSTILGNFRKIEFLTEYH